MERHWSELPSDVLGLISQFAANPGDHVRFSAVCKSWRFAAAAATKRRHLSPLLIFPLGGPYCAYDLHTRQLTDLDLDIPWVKEGYCCGSSHGWLSIFSRDLRILLLNPLTSAVSSLPPPRFPGLLDLTRTHASSYVARSPGLPDFPCSFTFIRDKLLSKIVLSSDPVSSACAAAAIFGFAGELAFCPPGGRSWTVAAPISIDRCGLFHDVVFHRGRGRFYAVDIRLKVYTYNVFGELEYLPPGPVMFGSCKKAPGGGGKVGVVERLYLAESRGDLLMISRFSSDDHVTTGFLFYRLDFCHGEVTAVEVTGGLGDQALFLGKNTSVLVRARDFAGCRSNRIYFADYFTKGNVSNAYGGPGFGIFDLATECIEHITICTPDPRTTWLQGIWLIPRERQEAAFGNVFCI